MSQPPLIFLQLNEINFEFVRYYVRRYSDLPAFKHLIDTFQPLETHGEEQYDQLEPWIQWVSAQTGKTYSEHGVFRLGDIVKAPDSLLQIFEVLEERGLCVGAISPMNARNRLKHPAYFVPDPWTDTISDASGFSRRLTSMLRQTVNDNASGQISLKSVSSLIEAILMSFSPVRSFQMFKDIVATRRKPWNKSLILDQLIHLVHKRLWQRKRPDVSFIFMNAGAHIQHHYLFNAEPARGQSVNPDWYVPADADPIHDMLKTYDRILYDYLDLQAKGVRLLVATGLTQVPYNCAKFYYRLQDHATFLTLIGARPTKILPRMTRDFEAHFDDEVAARDAADKLSSIVMERDGRSLFSEIELRANTVFATLSYPDEIKDDDAIIAGDGQRLADFRAMVTFVAIKNGMHSSRGFAFLSPDAPMIPSSKPSVHIAKLFDLVLSIAPSSTSYPSIGAHMKQL